MPVSLGALAVRFGCELHGDPDARVDRVASLQDAAPGAVAFLANSRYRKHLASTRATAVVLDAASAASCPTHALVAVNPYATYARIATFLNPEPSFTPGRHASAVVAADAQVHPTAWVDAQCFIGRRTIVEEGVSLGPGCIVLDGTRVGAGTRCVARVTLCHDVRIGQRCLLHPGVVIGADGFGQAPDHDGYVKVPQLGAVVIGNDVEIGANTAIDRGTLGDTVVRDGVRIDNLVQVGHNCQIGEHTVIAGCVGISGSVTIGRRCMIGGQVGIAGHLDLADDVYVTGKSLVTHSITRAGLYSGALPADDARRFRRNAARFRKLDQTLRRTTGASTGSESTRAQASDGDESE